MKRALAATILVAAGLLTPAFGQSATDQARIDYEAAKIALEQNQPAVALAKFERVIAALGEQPEILTWAGQAALAAGEYDKANDYKRRAFAGADDKFKASLGYKTLIELSARLDLLSADPRARQRDEADRARRELANRGIAPSEEALRAAAQQGDITLMRLIARAGVKPQDLKTYIDDPKVTEDMMVLELFHLGAQVDTEALCSYVGHGSRRINVFQELLQAVPFVNFYCGETPFLIHLIYERDWPDGIAATVRRGHNVNAQGPLGMTALFVAADQCKRDSVVALLAAGADPKIKDRNYKKTPYGVVKSNMFHNYTGERSKPACKATREALERVE